MSYFSHDMRIIVRSMVMVAALVLIALLLRLPRVVGQPSRVAVVSAASYAQTVAPDSIATIFGGALATGTDVAATQPLPTQLMGTTVTIGEQPAPLFFVSPNQINCLIPANLAPGRHPVVVKSGDGRIAQGEAQISAVSPGIFTANSSSSGKPSALFGRVRNGAFIYEDFGTGPIDLGPENEPLFLILYLTGLRQITTGVRVLIGNNNVPAAGVGMVSGLSGLDQVNVLIPRNLSGRGLINLSLLAADGTLSNEVQVDIAGATGSGAPQVTGFDATDATAGEPLVINGNNFNPELRKNIVRIGSLEAIVLEATSNRLRVRVPYGAESSPLSVINARTDNDRAEGRSTSALRIKTSLSGFVEDTRRQPLKDVTVRLRNTAYQTKTTAEGLYSFKDLPDLGSLVEVEIDPSGLPQLGSLPFPKLVIKKRFATARDNYLERIPLQQESGPGVQVGVPASFAPESPEQGGFARQIATGGVVFEVQPDTPALFPDGATTGRLTMTIVAESRTPIALPVSEYSSSVVQLTPFNVRMQRGGKLTFPNPERFAPGTPANLYQLETPSGQPTTFSKVGEAKVSDDGQRIETLNGAIDASSYYFVSLPRRSTTVTGRVVESDNQTPVRGALVTARGQTAITDGAGSFLLKSVLVNDGDLISVEAGYLRPNGRVDRGQLSNIRVVVNGITTLTSPIALTSQESSRVPIVLAPDSLIISEGEQKEVLLLTAHPDGGQIIKLEASGTNFASLENRGGGLYSLKLAPGNAARGGYTLRLIATDDRGQAPSYDIDLTVNGRPRANPQTILVAQNQPTNFTLTGEDPEGYALSYVIVVNPSNGRLSRANFATPEFTYTPNAGFVGNDELIFKVNDGLADSLETRATILVGRINRPPVLTVPGPQSIVAGNLLTFNVTANDPDTDQTLTVSAINRPGGSTFPTTNGVASGTTVPFTWTPTVTQLGDYTVTFEVADNASPLLKDTKTVAIKVTSPNNRPPLATAQSVSTNEDVPLNLTLMGSDPEGDTLSYLIVSNPANGTLNGNGAVRIYTPRPNFNGSDSFTFKVSDGALESATATVTITVNAVNDAPVLTVPAALTVSVGQPLSFSVSATDVDQGQVVTLSAANLPQGANFIASSGQFNWTPTVGQTGAFAVTFTAADNGNPPLTDGKVVTISVSNLTLQANAQAVATNEDTPLILTLTGSASAGTVLNYVIVSQPLNGVLSGNGANRIYTPKLNFNGIDSFTFKVSDGSSESNVATVAVTVNPVNDAPGLVVPGPQTVAIGQTLNFTVTASDVDAGQRLTLSATNLPTGASVQQTASTSWQFSWNPIVSQIGSYTVTLTVSDDGVPSLRESKSVAITVNQSPLLGWQPMAGPTFESIVGFAASGGYLFAGTASTIFRSDDNGTNWVKAVKGLPSVKITTLAAHEGAVFVGTSGSGVFRTLDNGENWGPVNNKLLSLDITKLFIFNSILFAGTNGSGVFRSLDNGANWAESNAGLTNGPTLNARTITAIGSKGTALYVGVVFPPSICVIFRSTDNGASWNSVFSLGTVPVTDFVTAGANLYAASGNVINRLSGESTWARMTTGLPTNITITSLAMVGVSVFAGTTTSVYRSTDEGANWATSGKGLPTNAGITALLARGTNLYAAAGGAGMARSTDEGANWIPANSGLTISVVDVFWINGETIYATASRTLYRSDNNGVTWVALGSGLAGSVYAITVAGSNVLAGTDNGGVFFSNNRGASWTQANIRGSALGNPVAAFIQKDQFIFAGYQRSGIFRSSDNGVNWNELTIGLPTSTREASFAIKGETLYVSRSTSFPNAGTVYQTTNNGSLWTALDFIASTVINSLAATETGLFIGTNTGVFRLSDNGVGWIKTSNGLTTTNVVALIASGNVLYAGTNGGGVFRSTDNGINWVAINSGLTNLTVKSLTLTGTKLYAGTNGQGIFVWDVTTNP